MENVISERQDASMRVGFEGDEAKVVKAKKPIILHVLGVESMADSPKGETDPFL